MGNSLSLRQCLACVLPCGALDLIRVVHLSGHVQEFSDPLTAGEILEANPGHVLTTPSAQAGGVVVRRVTSLSPDSQLRRGGMYFLIPSSEHRKSGRKSSSSTGSGNGGFADCDDLRRRMEEDVIVLKRRAKAKAKPGRRDRRSSHACTAGGAWRPHLQSISED